MMQSIYLFLFQPFLNYHNKTASRKKMRSFTYLLLLYLTELTILEIWAVWSVLVHVLVWILFWWLKVLITFSRFSFVFYSTRYSFWRGLHFSSSDKHFISFQPWRNYICLACFVFWSEVSYDNSYGVQYL